MVRTVEGPLFSFARPVPEPLVRRWRTYWQRPDDAYRDWKSLDPCSVFPPVAPFWDQPDLHSPLHRAQESIISPQLLMSAPQPGVELGNAQPAGDREKNQDQKKRVERNCPRSVWGVGARKKESVDSSLFQQLQRVQRCPACPPRECLWLCICKRKGSGTEAWKMCVPLKCWLVGLRAAAHTPGRALEKRRGLREGAWKKMASPWGPLNSQTEALCFLSCQPDPHHWWFWHRASSGQGKIWECVPGSAQGKPFHCGSESPLQVPAREGGNGTPAAQRNRNSGTSTVRTVSAW